MTVACTNAVKHLTGFLSRCQRLTCVVIPKQSFHITSVTHDKFYDPSQEYKSHFHVSNKWIENNDTVYAPREEGEPPRPAEIYHQLHTLPITPKKLWYSALMVRGLSIDEAIKQCEFSKKSGSKYIKEALMQAQEMAVHDFHVEFQSNLWVADSYCKEHFRILQPRRQRRVKAVKKLSYSYYFLRLREGQPPEEYYPKEPCGNVKLEEYVRDQRERHIVHSL